AHACEAPLTFCAATVFVAMIAPICVITPKLMLTGSRVNGVFTAAARSIRPAPRFMGLVSGAPVELLSTGRFAGFTKADLICAGDHAGWSCLSSAPAPAMCGVAMLVPWKNAKHGGEPQDELVTEESTFTPGAVASGLIWNVKGVGPRLEKPAMMSALGPSVK